MKQITITVPDNCELKRDGNTYIIVEKEKKLTYEDVAKALFGDKACFYPDIDSNIEEVFLELDNNDCFDHPNNCTSEKQVMKLLAINQLMNIAKYLNDGWKPNWDCEEFKYYISLGHSNNALHIDCTGQHQESHVYFKSVKLAKQAIEILGEETIKLALCTDY